MDTLQHTVYRMFILITTANFPDIMLPAYEASRMNSLFFVIYTFVGLFIIMNLLLAVVTNEYGRNQQKQLQSDDILEKRNKFLWDRYEKVRDNQEGLNRVGMYKYFQVLHWTISGKYHEDFGGRGIRQPDAKMVEQVFDIKKQGQPGNEIDDDSSHVETD